MIPILSSNFLIPLAIGGLVGLEREIYQQKKKRGFAGIRTYILTSFIAAVCSYFLAREELRLFAYIILGGLVLLIVSAYTVSAVQGNIGMTTELSVFLVFLLSFLSTYPEYQKLAVILGVVLAVLLSMKDNLHRFARKTQTIEWYDALTFIVMAFVVLPLLPDTSYTVLGVVEAINLHSTWLMVVFASGVSFLGYILMKVIGGSLGVGLAGLVGGLVSSTAVAESMSAGSKQNPELVKSYSFGIIGACVVMSIRVLFEITVVDSSMINSYMIPVLMVAAVGILFALRSIGMDDKDKRSVKIKLGTPLALKPALIFGVFFLLVTFLSKAMMSFNVGAYGFSVLGAVAGLIDVDAITLSMASLYASGGIDGTTAWTTIILAVVSNTVFKALVTRIFGTSAFFKHAGIALFAMAIAGIISLLLFVL